MPRGNIHIVDQLRGYERPPEPPPPPPRSRVAPIPDRARVDADGRGLHPRNVLLESFAFACLEDEALSLLDRLSSLGATPFHYRILHHAGALSFELMIRGGDVSGVAHMCGHEPPAVTADVLTLGLDAASLRQQRAAEMQVQTIRDRSISVLDRSGNRVREWEFVEHRRQPTALVGKLSERGFWSGDGVHGGQVLWPELMRSKRLAIGDGQTLGLLHLGLPLANVLFFLGALDWPAHLCEYVATRGVDFEHVSWDVSLELVRTANGVAVQGSALHGSF